MSAGLGPTGLAVSTGPSGLWVAGSHNRTLPSPLPAAKRHRVLSRRLFERPRRAQILLRFLLLSMRFRLRFVPGHWNGLPPGRVPSRPPLPRGVLRRSIPRRAVGGVPGDGPAIGEIRHGGG